MSVTLTDLAQTLDMAASSVCQILNGSTRYNVETVKKVKDAARRLGYRVNASARATRTGRFGLCSLLMPPEQDLHWLPRGLLKGLESVLAAASTHLILTHLPDPANVPTGHVPGILRQSMVDALLVSDPLLLPEAMMQLLKRSRLPTVWLNIDQPEDTVRPDDRAGGREATEILLRNGHRRIAFSDYGNSLEGTPQKPHFSQTYRWEGYRDAMTTAGLAPRFIGGMIGDAPAFTRAWLKSVDRPTAVVTYTDEVILPILIGMTAEGLTPGKDVSLITFCSDHWVGRMNLDAMILPGFKLGEAAAAMLLHKIAKKSRRPSQVIPMSYVPGSMIGPPPG